MRSRAHGQREKEGEEAPRCPSSRGERCLKGFACSYHGPLPGASAKVLNGDPDLLCEEARERALELPPIMAARYYEKHRQKRDLRRPEARGLREGRERECDTREGTGKLHNLPCPSGHPADESSQRVADEAGKLQYIARHIHTLSLSSSQQQSHKTSSLI